VSAKLQMHLSCPVGLVTRSHFFFLSAVGSFAPRLAHGPKRVAPSLQGLSTLQPALTDAGSLSLGVLPGGVKILAGAGPAHTLGLSQPGRNALAGSVANELAVRVTSNVDIARRDCMSCVLEHSLLEQARLPALLVVDKLVA